MNTRTTIVAVALAFGMATAAEGTGHEGHAAPAAKAKTAPPTKNPKLDKPAKPAVAEFIASPTPEQLKAAKPAVNKICPVSHDKIGGMGEPVQVIWKGRAYALCCGGCVQEFAKAPAKFAAEAAKEK